MAYSANPEVTKPLYFCQTKSRGVARGGGGRGARAPPEFGRSVNPIQTRGTDYALHTIKKAIYTSEKPDARQDVARLHQQS